MRFVGLNEAVTLLMAGGLLVYPTETFYALGALANEPVALGSICAIKGRPPDKPLPLLAGSRDQIAAIAKLDSVPAALLDSFWPGPLALVLPAKVSLPAPLLDCHNKICIRVSSAKSAAKLADCCKFPLVATSANLSGAKPARTLDEIGQDFWKNLQNCQLPWGIFQPEQQEPSRYATPSTILEPELLNGKHVLRLLRPGCIEARQFKSADWKLVM